MGKIAIVTDSNSGITQDQARELGISVIPMPFYITYFPKTALKCLDCGSIILIFRSVPLQICIS